jgi:hypothetical protein
MSKARLTTAGDDLFYGIQFVCPGCDLEGPGWAGSKILPVTWTPEGATRSRYLKSDGAYWGFNGDLERPTFTPSILSRTPRGEGKPDFVCHSFVRDGRIQFLNDCTHALAGQTVDLPDVDAYVAAQSELKE